MWVWQKLSVSDRGSSCRVISQWHLSKEETQGNFWIKHYSVSNASSVSFSRNPMSLGNPQLNILVAPLAVPLYSLTNISHWLHSFWLEEIPALLTLTSVSFRGPLNSALGLVNTQRTETQCQQAAPPRKHYLNPNCLPSTFLKTSYCASYVLVRGKIWVRPPLFTFMEGCLPILAPATPKISHPDQSNVFHIAMYNHTQLGAPK